MSLSDRFRAWLLQPADRATPPAAQDNQPPPAPPDEGGEAPIDHARMRVQLGLHEGVRDKIYTDSVGKVSIGIGRNLTDKGLRRDEIELMYRNDVAESIAELDRVLPWWRRLDEVRRRVLLDMMFNMGAPTLLEFKNTLSFIGAGDWERAANNMLASKWAKQVGMRAIELSELMRKGK
mgnify:CR=1 FL=1